MHQYRAFSRMERGHRHIKMGTVCQDYALASDAAPDCSVIVVADGHGGGDYFRSDRGAKFIVQAAMAGLMEFASQTAAVQLRDAAERRKLLRGLFSGILKRWRESLEADMFDEPFSESQMENVSLRCREEYMAGKAVERAYGTTLVAVLVTEHYWLGIQQGDGRCVAVRTDGSCEQPIPWDERCENNITTSVCDPNAVDEFRYSFSERLPAAVFVATDGVDAAYTDMDGTYGFCQTLASIYLSDGRPGLEKAVSEYLPSLSRRGTGDDVSIAGLLCVDRLEPIAEVLHLEEKLRKAAAVWERASHAAQEHEHEQAQARRRLEEHRAEVTHLEARIAQDEDALNRLHEQIQQMQEDADNKQAELDALRVKLGEAGNRETEAEGLANCMDEEQKQLQQALEEAARAVEELMDQTEKARKEAEQKKRESGEAEAEGESYGEDYTEPWAFVNRRPAHETKET